jgi:hypothetical protein
VAGFAEAPALTGGRFFGTPREAELERAGAGGRCDPLRGTPPDEPRDFLFPAMSHPHELVSAECRARRSSRISVSALRRALAVLQGSATAARDEPFNTRHKGTDGAWRKGGSAAVLSFFFQLDFLIDCVF